MNKKLINNFRLGVGDDTLTINTEDDLRTRTTTSIGNSYIGDINPWNKARDVGTAGYNYINNISSTVSQDLLIAKINKLEEKVDKLTKLLESIVD